MIGSLRGQLLDRPAPGEVMVEVGGVGYRVSRAATRWADSARPGGEVFLHVHTHVREDAIVLYGFAHADERRCFEALLGAHGVGPTLALADPLGALAGRSVHGGARRRRRHALPGARRGEEDRCSAAPRTQGPARPPDSRRRVRTARRRASSSRGEVRAALAELGYGPEEINGARSSRSRTKHRSRRWSAPRCANWPRCGEHAGPSRGARRAGRCRSLRDGDDADADGRSTRSPSPPDELEEVGLRPRTLDEFVGQSQLTEHLQHRVRGRTPTAASPSTTCSSPARPGWARPRSPASWPARWESGLRVTAGPGPRANRRSGRPPHRPAGRRRPVHRRDPSAAPLGRGDPLSGDGGLQARHPDRQGPDGSVASASTFPASPWWAPPPAPDWCPGRCATGSVSSGGSISTASTSLQWIVTRSAGILGVPVDAEGAAAIAARSRGTPRIANRLLRRVRDFVEVRAEGRHHRRVGRGRSRACSGSTSSASTRSTDRSSTCCVAASPAGRSA